MNDLLELPLVERYVTIACVSNQVGGDLIGNAKWIGVRLTDVLDMAGVRPGATQIVPRSVDGWTAASEITAIASDTRSPTWSSFSAVWTSCWGRLTGNGISRQRSV